MEKDKNILLWVIVAVAVLLILFGGMGIGGYGIMGFGMGFGLIFMLLFWGLIIWLIVTLINPSRTNKNEQDPLTLLKRKYASGEITKKQFESMKKEVR